MTLGKKIMELALCELKENYPSYHFMVKRDVTWILQQSIHRLIDQLQYPLEVYQDYPLERGCKEYKEHELVFVEQGMNYREMFRSTSKAELVVRVLYEPSRHRTDICEYHLPRVLIPNFMKELSQLKSLVETKKTKESLLILIDEYTRHRHQLIQQDGMEWEVWGTYDDPGLNVSVLLVHYSSESITIED